MEQNIVKSSINELELEFSKFMKESEDSTSTIGARINLDELDEIGEEIIKAKTYLESFANGERKSVRDKAYNQLSTLPMIGGWMKNRIEEAKTQALKDSGVKEVLESIFNNFEKKKQRLLELSDVAQNIGKNLQEQERKLQEYIGKLDEIINTTDNHSTKLKALDMSNQAQYQDKVIKEQVYNKLSFIVEMIDQLYMRMSKTIPAIKSQLMNETQIAGMINSISDSVKMMSELQTLTNNIARSSTEKVQSLIIDTTKDLSNGTDVEFYKESYKRNVEFQETMKKSRTKMIENTIKTYDELKGISIDTTKQLESRIDAERKALGMSVESLTAE